MKIMVSACLTGENCKYSGGNNRDEKVLEYLAGHEVISVCPEVMGGLPVPRVRAEIRDGIVMARDGRNVDREFREGARKCLEIALKEKPDLIILRVKYTNQCSRKGKGIVCLYVQLSPDIPYKGDPGYLVEEDPAFSFCNDTDNGNTFGLVKILGICPDQDADLWGDFPVFLKICQYSIGYLAKFNRLT